MNRAPTSTTSVFRFAAPHRSFGLASLTAFAVYLACPNRSYPFDAVEYATAVRTGVGLFHPHHLLYNWLGNALYVALHPVVAIEPLTLLATLNAVITAALMLVLMHLVLLTTGRRWLALALGVLYAASYGIWHMATSVEVYPAALLFESLALVLLVGPSSAPREIGAGLLAALGMLFHQTGIFFPLAALPLVLSRPRPLPRLLRFAGAATLGCGVPYAAAMASQGVREWRQILHWLFLYAHSPQFANGDWGNGGHLSSLPTALVGFGSALALPTYVERIGAPTLDLRVREILGTVAIVSALVALSMALVRARRRPPVPTPPVEPALRWTLALWALLEALFAFWWVPWNFEFWLLTLPPLVLLIGLLLRRDADDKRTRRSVIGAAVLLALGNFATRTVDDAEPRNNTTMIVTRALGAERATADDLVLSNVPEIDPYSAYFLGERLTVLTIRGAPDATALRQLRARIEATRRTHRVFALESEMSEAHGRWSRDDVARFYAELRARSTVLATYVDRGRRGVLYELR